MQGEVYVHAMTDSDVIAAEHRPMPANVQLSDLRLVCLQACSTHIFSSHMCSR